LNRDYFLTATLPDSVHLGSTAAYSITTATDGTPRLELTAGDFVFDNNLANETGWSGASVQVDTGVSAVFNTAQTLQNLTLNGTAKVSISSGTNGSNTNLLDITSAAGLSIDTSSTAATVGATRVRFGIGFAQNSS
jgi:hypothetical protein